MDQDVIEENQKELPQLPLEHVVYAGLEGVWGVGQPKRHDWELIMPIMASEGCLWDVLLSNPNLVVPRMKINL